MISKNTRLALLVTSAMISASSSMAQTAPDGTWTVASISNGATNSGTILRSGTITSAAISGGTGGSVSGSAIGASGSDSVSFATSGLSAAPSEQRTVTGATTLTGTNNGGGVTGTVSLQNPNIGSTAVSSSIAGSAVGAVGSLSVSSVNSSTYAAISGSPPLSTNNATYTGAVSISGVNTGATTVTGSIGTSGSDSLGATVDGTKNTVSLSAVGAAGSLSVTNNVSAVNSDVDPISQASSAEVVRFSDTVTVLGNNNAGGNVLATTSIFDAQITNGNGNSISGAAVGGSGSVSLSSIGGANSVSDNSVTFASTLSVTGDNTVTTGTAATVTVAGNIGSSGSSLATDDPVITAGNNNSISLAGVGASGSLSYSGIQFGSLSKEDYTVTGLATVLGTNAGAVNVGATGSGNSAAIYGGTVTAGNGNSISVAAVGASGSVSLNSLVETNTPDTTVTLTGGLNVDGVNAGAVTIFSQIGLSGGAANKPTITAGNGNSISVAAVGASGSVSYSDTHLGGTASEQFLIPGAVTVDGTNNAGGTVTATASLFGGTISGGNANSISVAAVGASGSVSADSLVIGGVPDNTLTFGSSGTQSITVVGANNAAVSLTGNLGSTGSIANDSPTIGAGNNNSISLAGVGASGSVSLSNTSLSGGDGSNNYSIAGSTTISGDNNLTVGVTATLFGGAVSGGTGNSISVSAVGSSASFSSAAINEGTGTLPTTSTIVSTGSNAITINSDNGGTGGAAQVTLLGSVGNINGTGGTDPTISGATTVTASISSAAVGASGSLSVSNLVSGGATPDETVRIGNTTFNVVNTASVSVGTTGAPNSAGIYGGRISAGTGGSISQAAVGASGSSSFTNNVEGAASRLTPGSDEYVIGTQTINVNNTGAAVSITGDIGTTDLANNASITGGVNNSISLSAIGASGSTSFNNMYSGGVTGGTTNAGVYSVAALSHVVGNTGAVTVTSNTYGGTIGGGVNGAISSAAVGASATTSFSVITR